MGIIPARPRGRPKGSQNKSTREREKRLAEAATRISSIVSGAFEGDAHSFLMSIYKDPANPLPVRIDAAKAAISYEKPKLASVDHGNSADNPLFPSEIKVRLVGA